MEGDSEDDGWGRFSWPIGAGIVLFLFLAYSISGVAFFFASFGLYLLT